MSNASHDPADPGLSREVVSQDPAETGLSREVVSQDPAETGLSREVVSQDPAETGLSREVVVKLGRLARIALSDEEMARLPGELSRIVAYARQLEAVDVEGVEPMLHATGAKLRLRADKTLDTVAGHAAIKGSAGYSEAGIRVPKVID